MTGLICLLALLLLATPAVAARTLFLGPPTLSLASLVSEVHFMAFTYQYNKVYATTDERQKAKLAFVENVALIRERNEEQSSYRLAVNEFADIGWDDFAANWLGAVPQEACSATGPGHVMVTPEPLKPPANQDWRAKGASRPPMSGVVTAVKNQGHCGSCWTFSSTGALEASHALLTGSLISLSEQQLVDCAGAYENKGCKGGLPSHAFEYVKAAGGIATEAAYPYHAVASINGCSFLPDSAATFVSGTVNITEGAENELIDAIGNVKPVSVAFQVIPVRLSPNLRTARNDSHTINQEFRFYKSGVFTSKICKTGPETVNHAVLAVGYATGIAAGGGPDHYIIKNSWGAAWGMGGYFLMAMGSNECGVATCASYPLMDRR